MQQALIKIIIFSLLLIAFSTPRTATAALLVRPPTNLGLVGYWSMDEGSGTKAMDLSGRGNNGTITGATWTSGKRGGALSFDGSGDFVNAGTSDILNMAGDFSASVWFKTPGPGLNNLEIIMGRATGDYYLNSPEKGWVIVSRDISGSNSINFNISGLTTSRNIGWTWVPDNLWHHVMVVNQGNLKSLYIDGVFINSSNTDVGDMSTPGESLFIGKNRTTDYFNGQLDDARIYNRALTAAEVSAMYKSGQVTRKQVSNQGLVGYWGLNEGSGTKAGDSSGLGNTGTITGATWTSGKKGGALSFNGTSDYTSVAKNFTFTNEITISAWVYLNSYQSVADTPDWGLRMILDTNKFSDPNGDIQMHYISIFGGSNGVANAGINWDTTVSAGNRANVNGNLVPLKQWHLITMTADGTNLKLYQNGAYVNQTAYTNIGLYDPDLLTIGKFAKSTFGGYFDGKIDDVRIYDRALSAAEIGELYKQTEVKINSSQNNKMTDGLVGLWSFDGKDINWGANTAYDRSGNNNHGTITNMSTTTSPTPGKIGQGLKFDGVNDHVRFNAATTNLWSISEPRTISFWSYINTLSTPNLYPVLFNFKTTGFSFSMYYSNQNNRKGINFGYNASTFMAVTSTDISSSLVKNWRHVILISDGVSTTTTSGYKLYVDGVSQSISSSVQSWASQNVNYIGTDDISSADTLNGIIDDVRIYNRALTASEILQLYNMGK